MSESQKAATSSGGAVSTYSTIAMLSVSLIIIGIQYTIYIYIYILYFRSQCLEALWGLINFLQMVYYMPLIQIYFPSNFYIFITEYLTLSNLKFGLMNPLEYLGMSSTDSMNNRFKACGMKEIMFTYNFGITLFMWSLVAMFYFVLCVLDKILPKSRCLWVRRYKKEYHFNTVWRMLLESFLELNISSMLNLFYVK